jgi:hypothetical protein
MANVDKVKVEKQAKEILDKFAKSLEKVEKEHGEEESESYVERDEFIRKEGNPSSESKDSENSKNVSCRVDPKFKKRILENSPNHDDDFIIVEKGAWKE